VRIAALYDIHANLPALDAVLAEIRRASVDLIVVGGDIVPGPMPRETIDTLQRLAIPATYIRGNGDREVVAARQGAETLTLPAPALEAIRWNAAQLTSEDAGWIASWPATLRVEIDGVGRVLFCHATPRNDTDLFTRVTPGDALRPLFDDVDADVVVCGHTHMPFDREVGRTRVVNAGSVGMPFGEPGAFWLLLGPTVDLRRTEYDADDAADRIRRTRFPQADQFAAAAVLRPPPESDMLEHFGRVGLR
jgi:putative phosphoesterase